MPEPIGRETNLKNSSEGQAEEALNAFLGEDIDGFSSTDPYVFIGEIYLKRSWDSSRTWLRWWL